MFKHNRGFTLLEMLVAIVILGILAAIAVPSYREYIRMSACEDARATLIGAGNLMERFRAQENTYANATLGAYAASPVDGARKNTTIAITQANATSYTLTASPAAGGRLQGATGNLTLTSAGVRGGAGTLGNAWQSCNGI